jgi:hypothetical protein
VQEDASHVLHSTHTFTAGGQVISAHMQQLAKQANIDVFSFIYYRMKSVKTLIQKIYLFLESVFFFD